MLINSSGLLSSIADDPKFVSKIRALHVHILIVLSKRFRPLIGYICL